MELTTRQYYLVQVNNLVNGDTACGTRHVQDDGNVGDGPDLFFDIVRNALCLSYSKSSGLIMITAPVGTSTWALQSQSVIFGRDREQQKFNGDTSQSAGAWHK